MMNARKRLRAVLLGVALAFAVVPASTTAVGGQEADGTGRTPPRLSYTDGDVFFWRPGADGWTPAATNTPLAPGDELATGHPGDLELQIGARAFARAWGDTQVGLVAQQPGVLHFRLTAGYLALDLRGLEPGRLIQLDTSRAAFAINAPGYYRAEVADDRVTFITRAGGTATMRPTAGQSLTVGADQKIALEGPSPAGAEIAAAPPLDTWDHWNYARTDHVLAAIPASSYVPSDVYGAAELDRYGTWRSNSTYGPLWVPAGVPGGWVPYSTGHWVWDPYYSWTWVDSAPWGWAPYHYGRWVFLDGMWAWAPGPRVVRPVYAPALVAFFGGPGVGFGAGVPAVSWVPLGWGEPVVPWWGSHRFAGRPWWGGWGGPRVVNNVIVSHTTVVKAHEIRTYRNAGVRNALVAVPENRFGGHPVQEARLSQVDTRRLKPVRGPLPVTPDTARVPRPRTAPPPPVADRAQRRDGNPPAARDGQWRERANAPRTAAPAPAPPAPRVAPPPPTGDTSPPAPRDEQRRERRSTPRAATPAPTSPAPPVAPTPSIGGASPPGPRDDDRRERGTPRTPTAPAPRVAPTPPPTGEGTPPAPRDGQRRDRANAPRPSAPAPSPPAAGALPTPPPTGPTPPSTPSVSPTPPPAGVTPQPAPRVAPMPPASGATPSAPQVAPTPPPTSGTPPPAADVRRPEIEGRGLRRSDETVGGPAPGLRRQDWNARRPDLNVRRPERGVRPPDPGFRRPETGSPRPAPRVDRPAGDRRSQDRDTPSRNAPGAGGRR